MTWDRERLEADAREMKQRDVERFEWFLQNSRDDRQAASAGATLTALSIAEIRRRAKLTLFCSDCSQLMVAAVVLVDSRPLLLARRRKGGFQSSIFLDQEFWGDVAYCRRRQHALPRTWLAEAAVAGVVESTVSHHSHADAVR